MKIFVAWAFLTIFTVQVLGSNTTNDPVVINDTTIKILDLTTYPASDNITTTPVITSSPAVTTTAETITTSLKPTTSPKPTTTTSVPNSQPTNPPNITSTSVPTTTVAPSHKDRHFDGPSFIGGIILASGLMGIAFISWKFYKARTERNYHTL